MKKFKFLENIEKKGFTLIELLAVIAILAILVVFSIPKVLKLFNDAKQNSLKIEAQSIMKAAEQGYATSLLNGTIEETTYIFNDGEEEKTGNIDLNITGKKIQYGQILITKTGDIGIALYKDGYCVIKNYNDKEISLEKTELSECFIELFVCGSVLTDERDSNQYETVKIGNQCWFKENLKYTGNGCLSNVWDSSSPNNACRTHNTSWGTEVLYQWGAAMNNLAEEGSQGLCPSGWHVPTDNEWKQLEITLGMTQAQADNVGWRGTDQGTKLKDNVLWNGTNTSGFTALPAGSRLYGSLANVGTSGNWWTSTFSGSYAYNRLLYTDDAASVRILDEQIMGFSIRCILGQ